ncbi:uncharacterized protein EKO05_0009006 [Ascochyta rabiei]|uniref:Uncharacterized protein n=1 Tax=Didymella rabiei TaxID=5454 RepID=A0A163KNH9_DIDRA|nr:uncharacterized protein EKO05_0009006 [Ascochyta rabiei]KZM27127.1 hypothetical protein ST47_g1733 [Ascochyta rabiei]UPX18714.1 hypothetical protein EKO05_0009006 [Ascochyta rabiei]
MPAQGLTKAQRMSYRIGRGEMGVLTFEPYKSEMLPSWRFKTPAVARKSAADIYARFVAYDDADDFVGMDMARKFLQMGMTRAKRYANHKGGSKYDKATGEALVQDEDFEGRAEKLEASLVFKEVWEKAKRHDGYQSKKERFQKEQKEWDKAQKKGAKTEVKGEGGSGVDVKTEARGVDVKPKRERRTKIKTEIEEESE